MTWHHTMNRDYTMPARPSLTRAVQRLILLNLVIFCVQLVADVFLGGPVATTADLAGPGGRLAIQYLAFNPASFVRGFLWTPLTYLWLHDGLMHLFFNMLWLFMFGPDVEKLLGTRPFYKFYVACGALGVLATMVSAVLFGAYPVIGASGAVMGVLVAFAMANPEREFFLFPLPFRINARGLVFMVVAFNLVSALLGALDPGTQVRTSVATHFGGMIAGYAYMKAIPVLRRWQEQRRRKSGRSTATIEEAVNNIFRFDEARRKRR